MKQNEFPLPPPAILLHSNKQPDSLRFVIDDPYFGKLNFEYTPGPILGVLARNFSKKVGPTECLYCVNHAMGLIQEKIATNMRDALEGLARESLFQTYRDLEGHVIFGEVKSKKAVTQIKKWHAAASAKRMGSRSGRTKNTTEFVRRVMRATLNVEPPYTQDKLSEAMRIAPRSLQRLFDDNGYTWLAVQKICKVAAERAKGRR